MVTYNQPTIKNDVEETTEVMKNINYMCTCNDVVDMQAIIIGMLFALREGNIAFDNKQSERVFLVQVHRMRNRIRMLLGNDSKISSALMAKRKATIAALIQE